VEAESPVVAVGDGDCAGVRLGRTVVALGAGLGWIDVRLGFGDGLFGGGIGVVGVGVGGVYPAIDSGGRISRYVVTDARNNTARMTVESRMRPVICWPPVPPCRGSSRR
jgi:hypothetical protein